MNYVIYILYQAPSFTFEGVTAITVKSCLVVLMAFYNGMITSVEKDEKLQMSFNWTSVRPLTWFPTTFFSLNWKWI